MGVDAPLCRSLPISCLVGRGLLNGCGVCGEASVRNCVSRWVEVGVLLKLWQVGGEEFDELKDRTLIGLVSMVIANEQFDNRTPRSRAGNPLGNP